MSLTKGMNSAVNKPASQLDRIKVPENYHPEADVNGYMNPVMLAYFKNQLQAHLKKATQEINTLGEAFRERAAFPDITDNAAVVIEQTTAARQIDTQRNIRIKIEIVLHEMAENGVNSNYGYCTNSGEQIGVKRLCATPYATLTVDEQSRIERNIAARRVRGYGLADK